MINIFKKQQLPEWFDYPPQFLRILNQNLIDLDPWYILSGDELQKKLQELQERYPKRYLIPFAKNSGSDDIACWDKKDLNKVFIIHDYAESGWEQRNIYNNFWDWFRSAIDDTIDFER